LPPQEWDASGWFARFPRSSAYTLSLDAADCTPGPEHRRRDSQNLLPAGAAVQVSPRIQRHGHRLTCRHLGAPWGETATRGSTPLRRPGTGRAYRSRGHQRSAHHIMGGACGHGSVLAGYHRGPRVSRRFPSVAACGGTTSLRPDRASPCGFGLSRPVTQRVGLKHLWRLMYRTEDGRYSVVVPALVHGAIPSSAQRTYRGLLPG
jgi:hypothetical protein